MTKKEEAKKSVDDHLDRFGRILELKQEAREYLAEHASTIVQKAISDELSHVQKNERSAAATSVPDKSLASRIEELGRGFISIVAGSVTELQMLPLQAAPASIFRRSQTVRQEEGLGAEADDPEMPDVVNWVPGNISSTVVGCQVSLVWKGSEAPSKGPNLRVVYDEEPTSFEENTKGARTIEISIDQPKPSRFVIDVSDTGEYVINLYSS
ncbi:hypothetical protein JMM61_19665 [Rhodovulum sulfidophilum]|uniref:hypothetical protein n=1 Tax=Rhodovulum sulfidophilum TaxID=35806 RepID=UPI0019296EAD|nr:hypothetical protein [Rhodovulum sulfidophilum]MBL3587551.1 hypothetical protein [Rhodovulum sulfidophilum]